MEKEAKNNVTALIIGIILIALVAISTFFRPNSTQNNSQSSNSNEQGSLAENIKKIPHISNADLLKKIQSQEDLTIIDLRPEESFSQEHVFNSQNISLDTISEIMAPLDKNKEYIFIDYETLPDSIATTLISLKEQGFANLSYLEGGFSAWKNSYSPTISGGDPNSFTDQSKVKYIKAEELKTILEQEDNILLIDVRKSGQFKNGHIKNATNIFLDDLEKRKKDIPLGKKIIVYDNDGLWGFKAAVRLFDMGFFNVTTVSDGLDAWKKKNLELTQ